VVAVEVLLGGAPAVGRAVHRLEIKLHASSRQRQADPLRAACKCGKLTACAVGGKALEWAGAAACGLPPADSGLPPAASGACARPRRRRWGAPALEAGLLATCCEAHLGSQSR
jgi:hypothetical protein